MQNRIVVGPKIRTVNEGSVPLRHICPGCYGHILLIDRKDMPCFGPALKSKGYRHLWYCPNCHRYCCCPVEAGCMFKYPKCPECNGKLKYTDKMAIVCRK